LASFALGFQRGISGSLGSLDSRACLSVFLAILSLLFSYFASFLELFFFLLFSFFGGGFGFSFGLFAAALASFSAF
jgi:hypothetical protein